MEALRIPAQDLLIIPETPLSPLTRLEQAELLDAQSILEIKLDEEEIELATGMYLVETTKAGCWYVGDDHKTGPISEMCDGMGGLETLPVRESMLKMEEDGYAEIKYVESKSAPRISDIMLTEAGRKEFKKRLRRDPESAERISQKKMSKLYTTITLVRHEVDNEYREIGVENLREFVSFSSLDTPPLAKRYLASLRKTQKELLTMIDTRDTQGKLIRGAAALLLNAA